MSASSCDPSMLALVMRVSSVVARGVKPKIATKVHMQCCGGRVPRQTSVARCGWMLVLRWQFTNSTLEFRPLVTATTITMGFDCGVSAEKLTKAKDDERVAMMVRKGNVIQKKRREAHACQGRRWAILPQRRSRVLICWWECLLGDTTCSMLYLLLNFVLQYCKYIISNFIWHFWQ